LRFLVGRTENRSVDSSILSLATNLRLLAPSQSASYGWQAIEGCPP
jgi:hypothetical protein